MSFIKYYELLITKRSAVELKLSCVPIVQWDPAIKKPLFKHDSKPLLLYNKTFSVAVVSLSYDLRKCQTAYREVKFL